MDVIKTVDFKFKINFEMFKYPFTLGCINDIKLTKNYQTLSNNLLINLNC